MADTFFAFDTSLSNLNDDEGGGEPSEDEYDALNDETFGQDSDTLDWEVEHEQLAEQLESSRRPHPRDDHAAKLEASLSQLVLDETDSIQSRTLGSAVWRHDQPFAPTPAPTLKNVCTVEELERQLRQKHQHITQPQQHTFPPQNFFQPRFPPVILQRPPGLQAPVPLPFAPQQNMSHNLAQMNQPLNKLLGQNNQMAQNNMIQNQMGQNVNQMGQNVNQMGQNVNQMTQNVNQFMQNVNQMGNYQNNQMAQNNMMNLPQNMQVHQMNQLSQNQMGQNVNPMGQNVNQMGQNVNQMAQNVNPMSQNVNQMSQNVNQMGQNVNQMGPNVNQMGSNVNQMGPNVNQMLPNGNQFNTGMNQFPHMMGQPRMMAPPPGMNLPRPGPNFSSSVGQFNQNFRGPSMPTKPNEQQSINQSNMLMNQMMPQHLKNQSTQINQSKPVSQPLNTNQIQSPQTKTQPMNVQGVNQMGQNVNPMGPNVNQMGPNVNQMAPNVNQMGPNVNQMGQNVNQMGQNVNHMNQNVNQMANMNHMGQNVNQMGQNSNQIGQNVHQMGHNINQMGQNVNQMGQNVNQMGQNVNQMGQNLQNQNQNQKMQKSRVYNNSKNMTSQNLVQLIQNTHPMLQFNNSFHNASHHPMLNNRSNMFNNQFPNNHMYNNQRHNGTYSNNNRYLMNGDDASTSSDTDEYAGLMTQREKQWLVNIQMLQLSSGTPYIHDFYYTVFLERQASKEKEGMKEAHKANQQNHPFYSNVEGRGERERERERHNSARLAGGEEATPRAYAPAQFENSLGKLQCGSVTAPRKIIDVEVVETKTGAQERAPSRASTANPAEIPREMRRTKQLLLDIEALYLILLRLEELNDPLAISNALILKEREEKQKQAEGAREFEEQESETNVFLRNIESVQRRPKPESPKSDTLDKRQVVNLAVSQKPPVKNLLDEDKDELINKMFLGLLHSDRVQQMLTVRKGRTLVSRFVSRVAPSHSRLRALWTRVLRGIPAASRRDPASLAALATPLARYIQNTTGWSAILECSSLLSEAFDPARTPYALTTPLTLSCICALIEKASVLANTPEATSNERQWSKFLKTLARALKNTNLPVAKPVTPISENTLLYHLKQLDSRSTIEILQRGRTATEFADISKADVAEQLVKHLC